jgi:RNA 2',3'-cyclic 3'-phosphodiesterase
VAKSSRSERPGSPRARLFVALEPAAAAKRALAGWRDELVAGSDGLRPVAEQALHLTLVFLGWQYERDVERIGALVAAVGERAAGGVPRLTPVEVKPIPPRGPRLFALDLEDEGERAGRLQGDLASALEGERLYRPEKRPFWPHLTLARVKRGHRAGALRADALPDPFVAPRLTLYRSTLRPQGAVYDPLRTLDLA